MTSTETATVRGRWFPASVVWPDSTLTRRALVVLVEGGQRDGLHVFTQPGDEPARSEPVDWERTRIPTPHQARNGFEVRLADNRGAVVTASSGCKCGALGRWSGPVWASTSTVTA